MEDIKLTQYSHGAGCGCKIAPAILEEILHSSIENKAFPNLLVGYQTKDDAAAYDLGNGDCILSTTDFFMPIVDDPYTFGQIAAVNSISDIYAMGGTPLMAISILGWPIELLSANIASQVLDGARSICNQANIPIAGGHSIDSLEPIFGLAVTGLVKKDQLKQNNKGQTNCKIYLTKPLGIGILTTAQKQKLIENKDLDPAIEAMTTLNIVGSIISKLDYVTALTDVTGFGLLGHLSEICEGSNISAKVYFEQIPLLPKTKKYMELGCIPGGAHRNFASYGHKIGNLSEEEKLILCDPQTSGGLLVMVKEDYCHDFEKVTQEFGLSIKPIGYTCPQFESTKLVEVI